ncbi:MAG: magnesium transporter [Candidatus Limnocylindria bacterium]
MTTAEPGAEAPGGLVGAELLDAWPLLDREEKVVGFRLLAPAEAEDFFLGLDALAQADLLAGLPPAERQIWMRQLAPDDAADLLQTLPETLRGGYLALFDERSRKEIVALLAYAEDDAGGLMSPRFVRVRPDMSVDEAIAYLRRQARERVETIYYVYVLDGAQHLLGVVSFRELFAAQPGQTVRDVMHAEPVRVRADLDQESVSQVIADHDLAAVPVVDAEGRMQGIVTVDDIVDVVREEATEDIQKIGGTVALAAPYLHVGLFSMVGKRLPWLTVLFVGQFLTTAAMSYFEGEMSRALVLALFIPLIISSGGNSGAQASTLVIRAMGMGEVRLRDWWRVLRRELGVGAVLGLVLGGIGLARVLLMPAASVQTHEHEVLLAVTVATSLVWIVLWGAIVGAMLPFLLRGLGFDPASASAPFVATLSDVTGIVIYFSVATVLLTGTLL